MKNTLKTIIAVIGFIAINQYCSAQSAFTIDASQQLTNFKFTDSEGTRDKNYLGNYSGYYSLGFRMLKESGFLFRAGAGMRNAGASLIYDEANYSWNLQYIEAKAGAGYAYKMEKLTPYLCVSPYFGYLLKANQTLNHQNYDIINSGSLNRMDYGVFISPGVQLGLSDAVSAYFEFNYMMGLANLETGDNGQVSSNIAYSICAGLAFSINK